MAQSARLEFRVHPQAKARIEAAAALAEESVSDFARAAALERAEVVLLRADITRVPSDFFDALIAELSTPPEPNARLAAAARRARERLHRDPVA